MSRLPRCVPALLAAAAVAVVVAGCLTDLLGGVAWRIGVALAVAAACAVGFVVHRLPALFPIGIALAGARVVTLESAPLVDRRNDIDLLDATASAIVGIGLIVLTGAAVRYRRGGLERSDWIDFATVAIGASLGGWLLVALPLIDEFDMAPTLALLAGSVLTVAIVLVTFIVDLLFNGLARNTAMRLVVASAATNLAAAATSTLGMVEVIDTPPHLELALYCAAALFAAAALSHPSARETFRPETTEETVAHTPFRLGLTAACLGIPTLLVALVAPVDQTDVVVRIVVMTALLTTVVTRLSLALSSHETARHELLHRLHHDELTALPTRVHFLEIVSDALEATWRSDRRPAIVQLNLDHFKNINDNLGHANANLVLTAVADRIAAVAAEFGGSGARIGGDDFAIVDSSIGCDDDAMRRVETIRQALATPVTIGEHTVFVTASIGVAVAPRNRTLNAEELLRRADIATNKAKHAGRNGLSFFDDSMQARLAQRMDVEQALHGAIGRNELLLYHQPIVDIATGAVSGFEALMRWQRDGTIVSPAEFIPIAEETGTINELGAWALHEALCALRGWIDDGVVGPDTTVSVNVSPRQIADPAFSGIVCDALEATGMPARLLWLEMTESMMLDEPELAERTLQSIREMGVRLALDDFGTGYSSLSLLQQFPIQRIKIDRAFVQGIAEHGNDRTLVRTIIAMAQSMGLDLVAEGVETVHQLRTLAELSCDKAQGYLISRPVPVDAMRSTMVALDELASLSLFQRSEPVGDALVGIDAMPARPSISLGSIATGASAAAR